MVSWMKQAGKAAGPFWGLTGTKRSLLLEGGQSRSPWPRPGGFSRNRNARGCSQGAVGKL